VATLTVQTLARAGLTPAYAAAGASGDEFPNSGKEWVEFVNANVSTPRTVTIVTPQAVDTLAVADRTLTVPASGRLKAGPWPTGTYNAPSGRVQMTYSANADLTVGVFKLGA
jgi:hypothetical protein